ncbi:membrane protein [Candidatus Magnetobacterium bavaricum]|uniref:Membrane protein n=1 Tax=Candidatus Magnetobacterium bavaricum TaxID=29290 RepID=A0A0F3GYP6_9BACT|nr:membrane protein [Candidatus Magnetobacterium bavaricum]
MSKESSDRPADKTTDRPTDKTTDRPTDKTTDRPADKTTDRPADKTTDRPADRGQRLPDKRSADRWSPKPDHASHSKKYVALMQTILAMETRLVWGELAYLFLNIVILFFSLALLAYATEKRDAHMIYISVLFLIVIGEFTCLYWIISSMKIQMKLKLRYFQARYMERRYGTRDEAFFTDEASYFNPSIGYVESPDKRERVDYPKAGATRMDGFAGSAKPRHLSWAMVSVLFFIYIALMLLIVQKILTVL